MKKQIFIVVLFLITAISGFSQKQGQELVDSLNQELSNRKGMEDTINANLLNATGRAYMNISEFDECISRCKQALTLSKKLNFKKGQGDAHHIMGIAHNLLTNYSEGLTNFETALKIREEAGDKKGVAGTTHNIGGIYANQGNYSAALNMYFKAMKINEEIGNKIWVLANLNNIAIIYMTQEHYHEALKILKSALKLAEELNDRPSQHHPYNNIGNVYFALGKYEEALKSYRAALEIRKEMNDPYEISRSLNNIGACYNILGNQKEALRYYYESLAMANEVGDKDNKMSLFASIADISIKNKEYAKAQKYVDTTYTLSKEIGSAESLKAYYEIKSTLDSATGNFKSAWNNYKLYVFYRDSLLNDENTKQLVQQQMQYDFDKKETAAKAEQEKKDAIALKELQKQKLVRNGFMGGFAVVMLFAGVFFTQRNRIKQGKRRSDELLLNILPSEVAEELKLKGSAEAKDFNEVTVLFTDFKNFTQMSEQLSAQQLVNEINYCYSAFDEIIGKHGIEKIKTIGDSYMCAGGLPVANTTHASDMVKAALEIRDFMLQEKQKREADGKSFFEIRLGCHTGSVVAGIVGVKKFAYDIWGDTVNIASRMESSGEAGKVNISGSTYELVKDKFSCSYRGKIEAKNKGEIDMYFVS